MGDRMEIFAARLATFDSILPSINSRTSSSRTIQPIAWPYDSPSPEQLAHAGFFFNPYDTNPDNTTCFLCRRALDGWEEGDNPISEHLKHAPDCGWAIIMDIQQKTSNPTEIEDPTSDAITEARRATFSIGWPHEGKRGWLCQSDKMVEAGWYFCPNEESPDLASCPYCKLSLDGWEETDDPFEEHHRRSSDCSFFVFALPSSKPTKKGSRSKKARVSKASRLSTQSVVTTVSEAPTVDDDFMDVSTMSQATTKKAKGTKKTTKSRAKKSIKMEPVEIDAAEEAEPVEAESVETQPVEDKIAEPVKPKRATRGKKRGSEAITQDDSYPASETQQPSPKRRATAIRSSTAQAPPTSKQDDLEEVAVEETTSPVATKKGRKGAKKGGSTKTRKASTASTTTKTSSNRVQDESILEAAIEADLARNLQDTEPFEFQYKDEEMESARFRKQSTPASIAPEVATKNASETVQGVQVEERAIEQGLELDNEPDSALDAEAIVEVPVELKAKKQPKRKPAAKKSKKGKASTQPAPAPAPEPEPEPEPELMELDPDHVAKSQDLEAQPDNDEEHQDGSKHKVDIESSPVQKSFASVDFEAEEVDQEITQVPPKKQERKAAKGKAKRTTRTAKTDNAAIDRAPSPMEIEDEVTVVDTEAVKSKSTTRKNAPKSMSREVDQDINDSDRREISRESRTDEMVPGQAQAKPKPKRGRPSKDAQEQSSEPEQVQAKPKRGRPSRDVEEREPEPEKHGQTKAKRGRPSKQIQKQVQEVHEVENKPQPSRSSKQIPEPEESVDEQESARSSKPAQVHEQEIEQIAEYKSKRGRSSKSKAPPKTVQRYSDLPEDRHRAQSFIESVAHENKSPETRAEVESHTGTQKRTPSLSPQSSDAENYPPSARPPSARPPVFSPAKTQTTRVPLATSTPTLSPSKRQLKTNTGYLSSSYSWKPSDIEELLLGNLADKENRGFTAALNNGRQILTSPEKKMTVEEWIAFNAKDGEERLKRECERLIGIFENEGCRAMRALEGIECID